MNLRTVEGIESTKLEDGLQVTPRFLADFFWSRAVQPHIQNLDNVCTRACAHYSCPISNSFFETFYNQILKCQKSEFFLSFWNSYNVHYQNLYPRIHSLYSALAFFPQGCTASSYQNLQPPHCVLTLRKTFRWKVQCDTF